MDFVSICLADEASLKPPTLPDQIPVKPAIGIVSSPREGFTGMNCVQEQLYPSEGKHLLATL